MGLHVPETPMCPSHSPAHQVSLCPSQDLAHDLLVNDELLGLPDRDRATLPLLITDLLYPFLNTRLPRPIIEDRFQANTRLLGFVSR